MTASRDKHFAQADEQRHRLDILQGIAEHSVAQLADERLRWEVWLGHASRHGRYGFTNTLLIPAQRRAATDVRSYDAWQKLGRQVRRGETGIQIISTRGRPRTVFDIEQTKGEEIQKHRLSPAEGLRRLSQVAADLGLYVDRGQSWTYLGDPGRRIQIAAELDDTTAASLLAHQIAHALREGGRIDTVSAHAAPCHGVRRVLADSVAYLVLSDLGLDPSHLVFPPPHRWAGTDARTDSSAAIRSVGDQVVRTSTKLCRRLRDLAMPTTGTTPMPAIVRKTDAPQVASPKDTSQLRAALADAHRFFQRHLPGSWGARYLAGRGFSLAVQEQWELGLAPRSRHALLQHLRELGRSDQTLIDAGLAKKKDDSDPFDLFCDRVLFPLRNENGEVIGFIGRRRDEAQGPKYLNTPETALFHKSETLFGLHEGRPQLASGVRPLLVEGPLDAIAVSSTMPDEYAAVAPCGTAITSAQIETIAVHSDLAASGLVIALDGDPAGRAGAIRAWRTLRNITGPVEAAVLLPGHDPAELLSPSRRSSVREALLSVTPLADLVIDERIQRFGGALEFVESRVAAAQAAAARIAELPPAQIARQVSRVAARTGMAPAEVTALVASTISPDPASDASLPQRSSPDHRRPDVQGPSRPTPRTRTHRRTA